MGFQLFETSGTFNPASWGLKTGDMLYIVAIGSGGGGNSSRGATQAAANGSASSFGSIVTAAGGACASTSGPGADQAGSCRGGTSYYVYSGEYGEKVGASGGDGWYPGQILRMTAARNHGQMSDTFGHTWISEDSNTAKTVPHGGNGIGCGGVGYGAGGGGGYVANDYVPYRGNSGCLVKYSYMLPDTNTIAITVGNGGRGAYYNSTTYSSGGGARGCVAVFW